MPRKKLPPITPGEVLLEEFLKPLGVSQYQLAKDVGVPPRRINEIVLGKRAVTAGTALRLARYFGTSDASYRVWPVVGSARPRQRSSCSSTSEPDPATSPRLCSRVTAKQL
jgi:addiction module HigA family antidote